MKSIFKVIRVSGPSKNYEKGQQQISNFHYYFQFRLDAQIKSLLSKTRNQCRLVTYNEMLFPLTAAVQVLNIKYAIFNKLILFRLVKGTALKDTTISYSNFFTALVIASVKLLPSFKSSAVTAGGAVDGSPEFTGGPGWY